MKAVGIMFCIPFETTREQRTALIAAATSELSPFINRNLRPGFPHPDAIDISAIPGHRNPGDECVKCQVENLPLTREKGEQLFRLIASLTRRAIGDHERHVHVYDLSNQFSPYIVYPNQRTAA